MDKHTMKPKESNANHYAFIDYSNENRTLYKDREPCELHCERHVTHPCERCGRIQAKGEVSIIAEPEK